MSWRQSRTAVSRVSDEPEDRRRLWDANVAAQHAFSPLTECGSKQRFTSEGEAVGAIGRLRACGGDAMKAYRCTWCTDGAGLSYWHIGHRTTRHGRSDDSATSLRPMRRVGGGARATSTAQHED